MTSLSAISGTGPKYALKSAVRGWRDVGDAAEVVEHRFGAFAGPEHGVAVDRLADHWEAVGGDAAVDGRAQLVDGTERVERAVDVDRLADRRHESPAGEPIGLDLLERRLDRAIDEVALARGPAEVRAGVLLPFAVLELLEMAAAGVGQRLDTGE